MAAVPAGRETRGEIISQGLKQAAVTKITRAARIQLNRILDRLYKGYDWPFLWTDVALTLSGQAVSLTGVLPDDAQVLKPREDDSLIITDFNGQTIYHRILERTPQDFRREAVPRNQVAQLPLRYRFDYSREQLEQWPVPEAPLSATFYCKQRPAKFDVDDEDYDDDIPIFDDAEILSGEIFVWALAWDKDARVTEERLKLNSLIADRTAHLHPRLSTSPTIDLDPGRFKQPFRPE